jgi:parallel beta-helix repeat protein
VGNSFTENNCPAIYLSGASNNTFYHNNFINNKVEGLQVSNPWLTINPEPSNIWDNGYEGNYWSDYISRYPTATEVNGSGIWNTPFFINEVNIDRFPIKKPVDIELVTIPEFPSWTSLLIALVTVVAVTLICRWRLTMSRWRGEE